MSKVEMRDVDEIADEILPVDGPHTPEGVIAAAGLISELVRRLNHASLPHRAGRSLPYPSTVDAVVGRLQGAAGGLPQLLGRLAARLDEFAADPALYDDRYSSAPGPAGGEAVIAGLILREQVVPTASALSRELGTVRSSTTHLGIRE